MKLNLGLSCQQAIEQEDSFRQKFRLKFRMKPLKCYIRCTALYGAETWTFRKVDQKYLESFEIRCCRRMEISCTNYVRHEEVLQRVKVVKVKVKCTFVQALRLCTGRTAHKGSRGIYSCTLS